MELFLAKKDAVFLVSLGFNRIWVDLHYYFEDNMDFFFFLYKMEEVLKHVNRAIDITGPTYRDCLFLILTVMDLWYLKHENFTFIQQLRDVRSIEVRIKTRNFTCSSNSMKRGLEIRSAKTST